MIPLALREDYVPGMVSAPVPSRHRCQMLRDSVASLRDTAARPDLVEILVAYDPDDEATGDAARELNADLIWKAPERYGFTGQSMYYAALISQCRGEWVFVTWSDDAVMETPYWDDLLRAQAPGTIAYTDGNWNGQTCFPAVHRDALAAVGRLSPLPSLDTWFEDAARDAGVLVTPHVYVRQDRADLNGRNDDQVHREGGAAWRAVNNGTGQDYYREPYTSLRAQDAAALKKARAGAGL